ncbi:MAG TPA: hypothetical protein VGH98_03315 [Gemmatimonadaceae bacterium]|jgi:hypothetical protein
MRTSRALALALAALTLLACETSTSPVSQRLVVTSDGTALTLTNTNSWPVFYMAVDPNFLATTASGTVADFALCDDPSSCPRVAAKSSVRVPYSEIAGYHVGQTAVRVTQWRLQRSSSGNYEATDIQSADLDLH